MHPKNKEQSAALKAMAKALKVAFETDKGRAYDPAFVAEVLEGVNDRKAGKSGRKVDLETLWK